MSPRPYRMDQRRQASETTRAAIIEAAREELLGDDTGFSIDAVARRADVARMTLYNQFGSKLGLLEAIFDDVAAKGGMARVPAIMMRAGPLDSLAGVIELFCEFWASDRALFRRLFRHGLLDPALSESHRERNERRRRLAQAVVERVIDQVGELPISRDEAVDLLFTLTSFETYDSLAAEGRPVDEVARLVLHTLRAALGIVEPVAG